MNEWKLTGDDPWLRRWQDIATEKKQVFNDVFLLVDTGGKPKCLIGCWVSRGVMEGMAWKDTGQCITEPELNLLSDRYWDSCYVDRLFTKKYDAYMCRIEPSCLFNGTPTHWMPLHEPTMMEGVVG